MNSKLLVYINGKWYPKAKATVSVYDHGFLYGDGVFEGIRAYDGVVFKLKEHIDRLYHSAHVIMLTISETKDELINAILETLRKNNLRNAYIRVVNTRGIGDLGIDPRKCQKSNSIIITDYLTMHSSQAKETGIRAIITWIRRNPVDSASHEIKSLNYLNSILGKIESNNAGVDEAICLNSQGYISEGIGENLFLIQKGIILTPPTSAGALRGITRGFVIQLAKELGYVVKEQNLTPTDLFTADEAFFTGTGVEIVPIVEINRRRIGNGKPSPITKTLMNEFSKRYRDPKEGILISEIAGS